MEYMNTDEFVILRAKRRSSGDYILLCHLPQNNVTPWVTWFSHDITGSHRMNGNYFYEDEETDALKDFEAR
jgi:hypothetical protein